jgi:hypothetical protein
MNLKDILQLSGEQGKVVIVGEDGEVKGVLLSFDEYTKMGGSTSPAKSGPRPSAEELAEQVNREILQAQLEEVISSSDAALPELPMEESKPESFSMMSNAERIDSLIQKRAQNLFKSMPYNYTGSPEVTSTPANDEEIRPNFDDI